MKKRSQELCEKNFELNPHQQFVRNFLSFQTPYNSLLLYHGLGSGKTCSAITVAEEMRSYLKQMNIRQRIIVVASPNVQENFKLQLFDDRKLKKINGEWNISSCTGNSLINEVNPIKNRDVKKEVIVKQIKKIIQKSYLFMGYIEFANFIKKIGNKYGKYRRKNEIIKEKLNNVFNNRFIIIDEIHNIRISENNTNKRVAIELEKLVDNVKNLRLLLLSATPMYNNYKEIIWLLNLMNKNDGRSTLDYKDVFTKKEILRK